MAAKSRGPWRKFGESSVNLSLFCEHLCAPVWPPLALLSVRISKKVVMSFAELELSEHLLRAVREEGYEVATPIQLQAIPPILAGNDLFGCAQTGTGKTAAFALPTLQRLLAGGQPPQQRGRPIRTLVLAPTRELAAQIGESFRAYGRFTGLRHTVIFGGVGQMPQVRAIQHASST